jgi:hypothetical protein
MTQKTVDPANFEEPPYPNDPNFRRNDPAPNVPVQVTMIKRDLPRTATFTFNNGNFEIPEPQYLEMHTLSLANMPDAE